MTRFTWVWLILTRQGRDVLRWSWPDVLKYARRVISEEELNRRIGIHSAKAGAKQVIRKILAKHSKDLSDEARADAERLIEEMK